MIKPRGKLDLKMPVHRSGFDHSRAAALRAGPPHVRVVSNWRIAAAAFVLVVLPLAGLAGWPIAVLTVAHAKDGGGDNGADLAKQMREQQREQERQAKEQQRQAEKQQREAEKQQREAEKQQRQTERQQQSPTSQSSNSTSQGSDDRSNNPPSTGGSSNGTPQGSAANPSPSTSGSTASRDDDSSDDNDSSGVQSPGSQTKTTKQEVKSDDNGNRSDKKPAAIKIEDAAPPPTVEKWLKKITSTDQPDDDAKQKLNQQLDQTPGESANAPANGQNKWATETKTSPSADAKPANGKTGANDQKTAKAAAPGRAVDPIAFPTLATPDVLAVNATPNTLARAVSLGFKPRPASNFSNLGMSVTALVAPAGMNPAQAKALLTESIPNQDFASNKKYRIYRTASGTEAAPAGSRAAAVPKPGTLSDCSADRCFARDIIGWKPELGACVSGVKVGIIDTSVDVTHPAFFGKKLEVHHFGADGAPQGPDWHGTGVTALLAGDASSGTPGLIPAANFYVADIFTPLASSQSKARNMLTVSLAGSWSLSAWKMSAT